MCDMGAGVRALRTVLHALRVLSAGSCTPCAVCSVMCCVLLVHGKVS